MNSSAKKIKSKGPSMIPAISPNGLAGIVSGIDIRHKSFFWCLSIHQVISSIVYFCIKDEGFFPSEKHPSNPGRLSASVGKRM